jgi:uncharacterized protein (TIGR03067 family)
MRVKHLQSSLVAVAVSLTWFSVAPGTEPVDQGDLGRLQGRWTARAGARRAVQVTLDIQGQRVRASFATPQGACLQFRGELKLVQTSSPRSLDWINFTGADQQEFPPIPAIYKIDRDTLTVCNGGLNGSRPKEFKPGEGALADVVVFQRVRTISPGEPRPPDRSLTAPGEARR